MTALNPLERKGGGHKKGNGYADFTIDSTMNSIRHPPAPHHHHHQLEQEQQLVEQQTHNNNNNNNHSHNYCDDILLPVGDINFLIVTDIHSWIAGQHKRHEPQMNVDFGDLLSLYEQLQNCSTTIGGDWFLLFNGDFMDGTGLSTLPQPIELTYMLQQMPFSVLNVGNHELYFNEVVDYLQQPKPNGFVNYWNGTYLSSNVDYIPSNNNHNNQNSSTIQQQQQQRSFGNRYTFLYGTQRNITILTFGFLYNFENHCTHTYVQKVQDTIQEDWFISVVTNPPQVYDVILILAHMDAIDPLVYLIQTTIRNLIGPYIPIQFITGHSHRRHYEYLDPQTTTLEAGRFMDTIGFTSLTLPSSRSRSQPTSIRKEDANDVKEVTTRTTTIGSSLSFINNTVSSSSSSSSPLSSSPTDTVFQHLFLETNRKLLQQTVWGTPTSKKHDFSTIKGKALSRYMEEIQQRWGLLDVVTSCAPSMVYELNQSINDTNSLWWLYIHEVIPKTLFPMLQQLLLEEETDPLSTVSSSSFTVQQPQEDKDMDDTSSLLSLSSPTPIPALVEEVVPIFLQGTGALRYSLFGPIVVVDDIIAVTPFENPIYQVGYQLAANQLEYIFKELQVDHDGHIPSWGLPNFGVAGVRPTTTPPPPTNTTTNINTTSTTDTPATTTRTTQQQQPHQIYYDLYTVQFHLQQVYDVVHPILSWNNNNDNDTNREGVEHFLPRPIFEPGNNQKPLGTTKLWFDFVRDEWKCPPSAGGDTDLDHSNSSNSNIHSALLRSNGFVLSSLSSSSKQIQQQQEQPSISSIPATISVLFLLVGMIALVGGWKQQQRKKRIVTHQANWCREGSSTDDLHPERNKVVSEVTSLLQSSKVEYDASCDSRHGSQTF